MKKLLLILISSFACLGSTFAANSLSSSIYYDSDNNGVFETTSSTTVDVETGTWKQIYYQLSVSIDDNSKLYYATIQSIFYFNDTISFCIGWTIT